MEMPYPPFNVRKVLTFALLPFYTHVACYAKENILYVVVSCRVALVMVSPCPSR